MGLDDLQELLFGEGQVTPSQCLKRFFVKWLCVLAWGCVGRSLSHFWCGRLRRHHGTEKREGEHQKCVPHSLAAGCVLGFERQSGGAKAGLHCAVAVAQLLGLG